MSSPEPSKSYLSAGISGISALSPWGSRSATPKPAENKDTIEGREAPFGKQRANDHTVSHINRLSLKSYPPDCPPLNVQWYHAVDVPKRKPLTSGQMTSATKPALPSKWVPFSARDSKAIEGAYQKLAEEEDAKLHKATGESESAQTDEVKVPVNEDYLFDVNVEKRELGPAYWLGPIYAVRRGVWFYAESPPRPVDENLAIQLEEGYLKVKAWRFAQVPNRSESRSRSQPSSGLLGAMDNKVVTPKSSADNLNLAPQATRPSRWEAGKGDGAAVAVEEENKTFRLFGSHMNSAVTYQDASVAWLLTDDFLMRMSSTVYQRFAGGGHFAGTKLVRGYKEPNKADGKDGRGTGTPTKPSFTDVDSESKNKNETKEDAPGAEKVDAAESVGVAARRTLERHISSLVIAAEPENKERQEEEVRKREEQEIQDDYKEHADEEQDREIEHLLLVTHGIGQRLGLRMESVNFVHDVNTMRKSLKAVYGDAQDLQALNGEVGSTSKNCRVQVLPICWRHLLDFPKQSLKHNRKEFDLGDIDGDEEEYPNLDDITVEGVPAVRNLITDLALDILLYQSPAYKGHITRIVLQECNRSYKLFTDRNPNFKGKVSLVGHSLGSAIMFDILCRQQIEKHTQHHRHKSRPNETSNLQLNFDVQDFYALGSPIGLFQMLKGRTIAARHTPNLQPAETPQDLTENPFLEASIDTKSSGLFEVTTSSPKCHRIFNVFHPTDPISYRLEPLISPAMSALKPQPLPYTKKGIFGAPAAQGLGGIGARVGQSVTGLWTSFSTGIASSLLNRSLGISGEDASRLGNPAPDMQPRAPQSIGAGTNAGAGVIPSAPLSEAELQAAREDKINRVGETGPEVQDGSHPPTLIDTEIETLFSGFQKRRKSHGSEKEADKGDSDWPAIEEQSRRLRREEAKVRALNDNGRVDYAIQEGAFDISLLASIASHLSYWADEDVSHFVISQLLSRTRVMKKAEEARLVTK